MITLGVIRLLCGAFAAAVAIISIPSSAQAERRVAMVVGINTYPALGADAQLQRALSDADGVSETLKKIGFSVTTLSRGVSVTHDIFLKKFSAFLQEIQPGDIAVFYFAGHGFANDRANYLVPADMPDLTGTDEYILRDHALTETALRARIRERSPRVVLMMLDACRNNPFQSTERALPFGRGLQAVEGSQGVLTIYAAGYGQSALDRLSNTDDPSPNSVFTRVVIDELARPGVNLLDFSEDVRDKVASLARSIGSTQVPAVDNELIGGRSVFLGGPPIVPPPIPVGPSPDEIAWTYVQTSTDVTTLRRFVSEFPTSRRQAEAQDRLASLETKNADVDRKGIDTPPVVSDASPDVRAWSSVATSTVPSEIRTFLDRFPGSSLHAEAEQRLASLDETTWQATANGNVATQQHYLDLFPQGAHAAQGQTLLANLEKAKVDRQAHEADDSLWDRTGRGDIGAQRRYLALFPDGLHARDARSQLAKLELPALREVPPHSVAAPHLRPVLRRVEVHAPAAVRVMHAQASFREAPVHYAAERVRRAAPTAIHEQHRSCFVFAGESHCQ